MGRNYGHGGEIMDTIDSCVICGKEIPPGPDFCSDECEQAAARMFADEVKAYLSKTTKTTYGTLFSGRKEE